MTPEDQRRAFYAEMAETFGRSAQTEIHLGWAHAESLARLAAHFGRLALGQTKIVDEPECTCVIDRYDYACPKHGSLLGGCRRP